MTDEDLIGYALDLDDPADRAGFAAYLAAHPEAISRLGRVLAAVAPLAADRDDPDPPPGLAVRTVARLAAHLVEQEQRPAPAGRDTPVYLPPVAAAGPSAPPVFPADGPEVRAVGGRFRLDWVVAAGLGLVAVGLGTSFVGKLRHNFGMMTCQNNLRELYHGVSGYADTHAGRLPEVGDERYPAAESFVAALADAGQYPDGFRPGCPAGPAGVVRTSPVGYTYPLGYRSPGGAVVGLRRADGGGENDLLPVAADLPADGSAPTPGPTSPHRSGQNVLYLGGQVRYATTPAAGLNGDDIYRNQLGRVAAGLGPTDTVLGRPGDRP